MGQACRLCPAIRLPLEENEVKALSLKQPWAELVVSGKKIIEIRKWNTKFRGEFLIHASRNTDAKAETSFGFKICRQDASLAKQFW